MNRAHLIALGALLMASGAAAQELGRLFFTPQERFALDTARTRKPEARLETVSPQPAAPQPDVIRLNGFIRRNDGGITVWINDAPTADYETRGEAKPDGVTGPERALALQLPEGKRVKLKVGQRLDAASGEIRDAWDQSGGAFPVSHEQSAGQETEKRGTPVALERNR
jgi:hypothetical protein